MEPEHLLFDMFTLDNNRRVIRLFEGISLTAAEILSGLERDTFDMDIMHRGWSGSNPAWTGFKPVVILPHGDLIKHDQFMFLIELAG